ncbi:hypothetical protein PAXINDRAFT_163238 [Paxillus involutus ATCC 200175]|uniref:Uncharacterized protein n=1 Tax=Paxillus involutus ATCC 200175 TaxID=664439 RepID=A0A0C9U6Q3_PAXIN|nr:hypothetical protein PAXINDRAFT_163238 [Paxillus involutus ATCC 200175]
MIVDAEYEDAHDSVLNPDPHNLPQLNPQDLFLLGDPSASSNTNGVALTSASGSSTPLPAHVSWLRKTRYLRREGVLRSSSLQDMKPLPQHIDISRPARLRDIEASFAACNDPLQFDLSTPRHPNKPNITESYEIYPDVDIWANAFDLFRFGERAGERPVDVGDPRLDCAILRPMESDGEHFLAYYLTKDDEPALEFKERRQDGTPFDPDEERKMTTFHFVCYYETVKIEQEVPNGFFLGRNALTLNEKRINAQEAYVDKWQVVHISHVPMSKEELDKREELLTEVADPSFLLNREDADADGEIDVDAVGNEVSTGTDGGGDRGGIMADIF